MADAPIISGAAPPGDAAPAGQEQSNSASLQQELQELKAAFQEISRRENNELDTLRTERDNAAAELKKLQRQNQLIELAGQHNFPDIEYLDFVLQKNNIDPEDPAQCRDFLQKFQQTHPHCFVLPLTPGAGSRPGSRINSNSALHGSGRMELLEDMLSGAPEIF